tara:strand:+ start:1989 stop:2207 length:219 start_codon:yes stop_codon:yes gene_type:complete
MWAAHGVGIVFVRRTFTGCLWHNRWNESLHFFESLTFFDGVLKSVGVWTVKTLTANTEPTLVLAVLAMKPIV